MLRWTTQDYVFNITHLITLVTGLVFTIVLMANTLGANSDRAQFFITNTYLSTYASNNPLGTYTPISDPLTEFSIRNSYYQCLRFAEVGIDTKYNCKSDGTLDSYIACVNGLNANATKYQTMMWEIKRILGEYKGTSYDMAQLPSMFTSDPNFAALTAALASNDMRVALKNQLGLLATPLATDLLAAITQSEAATGIPACLSSSISSNRDFNLQTLQGNLELNVDAIFQYLWKCASDTVYTEPVQKMAYDKCFPLETWPAKDVLQTPYTQTLFGSYNKYFVTIVAAWLLCSFVVYTCPGLPSNPTVNGKPENFYARAGKGLVTFGFVWNVGGVIMVLARSFSSADSWNNFPMSIQTVLMTSFFSITALLYFGREIYELFFLAQEKGFAFPYQRMYAQANPQRYFSTRGLTGFMRVASDSTSSELNEAQYIPLVAPVWSDAFFFVDGLLFLGVVGTVYDTVTIDIVQCVFILLVIALINSVIVRVLYEGYINETPETSSIHARNNFRLFSRKELKSSEERPLQAVRVMAMLANIINVLLQVIVLWLCIKRFGFNFVTIYLLLSSTLPQLLWLILTFCLDFQRITSADASFRFISAIFLFSTIVRVVFIAIMGITFDYEYKLTVDNEDSLNNLFKLIGMEGPRNAAVSTYS